MPLGKRGSTAARKKIVFVIVEGPSDDEALGVLLDRINFPQIIENIKVAITNVFGAGYSWLTAIGSTVKDNECFSRLYGNTENVLIYLLYKICIFVCFERYQINVISKEKMIIRFIA